MFLLGYFNCMEIELSKNNEKAYNLFINTLKKNHILTRYLLVQ
jgi:hypothetical protein